MLNIYHSANEIDVSNIEIVICCGKGLGPRGEVDWVLKNRIDLSIDIIKKASSVKLLLSGGIGTTADSNTKEFTEAEAMYRYIQEHNPEIIDRVLKETVSEGSLDQLCKIKQEIINPLQLKHIALVTDEFHINRMSILFDSVLGDGFNTLYFGSKMNLYGKYRKIIEDYENENFLISKDIVQLIPR